MRIAVLIFAISSIGCHRQSEAPAAPAAIVVHCAAAESHAVSDTTSVRGTVTADPEHHAIVSAQVAGRLMRVALREGDAVARGAVIAELERRTLQNSFEQAEAQLARASAIRDAARPAATRAAHLFERGIAARQAMEAAEASLAEAESNVAAARAQVDIARQNLERAVVRAPIGGVIVRLLRQTGEVVDGTPSTPIVEIADPAALEFTGSAAPADLVKLRVEQPARITFDALPKQVFGGVVRSVAPAVDAATGVGTVRITVKTTTERPPFGLLGEAEIDVGAPHPAVVVPAAAVRNAGGDKTEVVVCRDGKASVRRVEVSARRAKIIELAKGLSAGERVATDELTGLEDGALIQEAK